MRIELKLTMAFLMILSFLGGWLFPFGIIFLMGTVPLAIVITCVQIYKTRSPKFLVVFLLPIVLSFFIGLGVAEYQSELMYKDMYEIVSLIDQYYEQNQHLPDENNPIFQNYDKVSIRAEDNGSYVLYYKIAQYHSDTKEIHVRPY